MATVSNRFYVTCIADSSALSSVLYTTDTLTQVYNPVTGKAFPSWNEGETGSRCPTIYSVVRVNGTLKQPVSNSLRWTYNGEDITFDSNNVSTDSYSGLFRRTTYSVTIGGVTLAMPALKIIKDLAVAGNTDNDVIGHSGSVELGGSSIGYSNTVAVRLTQDASSGYQGLVWGDSYVNSTSQPRATVYMQLFKGENNVPASGFSVTCRMVGSSTAKDTSAADSNTLQAVFAADEITDNAVVEILFQVGGEVVYRAHWNIDDTDDPEQMYIGHGKGNQNNASLREGEEVAFHIWMARSDDATKIDTRYTQFGLICTDSTNARVKINKSSDSSRMNVIALDDSTTGVEQLGITVDNVTVTGTTKAAKSGMATITYDFGHALGDYMTGFCTASSGE